MSAVDAEVVHRVIRWQLLLDRVRHSAGMEDMTLGAPGLAIMGCISEGASALWCIIPVSCGPGVLICVNGSQ